MALVAFSNDSGGGVGGDRAYEGRNCHGIGLAGEVRVCALLEHGEVFPPPLFWVFRVTFPVRDVALCGVMGEQVLFSWCASVSLY